MDGLRDVARIHRGTFRLTPNQNLIIAGVNSEDRPAIEAVLQEYGIGEKSVSMVRRNSMACVALPTCALAMAESERYLPDLMTKIEALLEGHGLAQEPITVRMTGCPNGCARPYIRSEEHTSELQSLMRISYAVLCLRKKKNYKQ